MPDQCLQGQGRRACTRKWFYMRGWAPALLTEKFSHFQIGEGQYKAPNCGSQNHQLQESFKPIGKESWLHFSGQWVRKWGKNCGRPIISGQFGPLNGPRRDSFRPRPTPFRNPLNQLARRVDCIFQTNRSENGQKIAGGPLFLANFGL